MHRFNSPGRSASQNGAPPHSPRLFDPERALANWLRNDVVSMDMRPSTSMPRTTRRALLLGPTSSGYVRSFLRRALSNTTPSRWLRPTFDGVMADFGQSIFGQSIFGQSVFVWCCGWFWCGLMFCVVVFSCFCCCVVVLLCVVVVVVCCCVLLWFVVFVVVVRGVCCCGSWCLLLWLLVWTPPPPPPPPPDPPSAGHPSAGPRMSPTMEFREMFEVRTLNFEARLQSSNFRLRSWNFEVLLRSLAWENFFKKKKENTVGGWRGV